MNLHGRKPRRTAKNQALPRYRRPRYPRGVHTQIDSNSVTVSTSLMSKPSNSAPKPNPSNDDLLAMGIDPEKRRGNQAGRLKTAATVRI